VEDGFGLLRGDAGALSAAGAEEGAGSVDACRAANTTAAMTTPAPSAETIERS
jgi:hypothetical protein